MDRAKRYLLANFENLFVLVALLSTAGVNYLVPTKLAFLNFYFLPIILAGYYLGRRSAVLGALLCTLMSTPTSRPGAASSSWPAPSSAASRRSSRKKC